MARMYLLKGHANYDNVIHKKFEVVVPLESTQFGWTKIEAIQKIHPDWEAICVDSWEEL
jgi:hypothetical protein